MYANRLNDQQNHLEKENEEKDHKVETRITAECFVGWTVPEWIKLIVNFS